MRRPKKARLMKRSCCQDLRILLKYSGMEARILWILKPFFREKMPVTMRLGAMRAAIDMGKKGNHPSMPRERRERTRPSNQARKISMTP